MANDCIIFSFATLKYIQFPSISMRSTNFLNKSLISPQSGRVLGIAVLPAEQPPPALWWRRRVLEKNNIILAIIIKMKKSRLKRQQLGSKAVGTLPPSPQNLAEIIENPLPSTESFQCLSEGLPNSFQSHHKVLTKSSQSPPKVFSKCS